MGPKKTAVLKSGSKQPSKSSGKKTKAKSPAVNRKKKSLASGTETKTVQSRQTSAESGKKTFIEWTAEDEAATKIQKLVRGLLARAELQRRRNQKAEYEALMDKLQQEAFVKVAQRQQEEAERQFQRNQEERRRRQDAARRQRRFLDAAFEGNNDELNLILKEVSDADSRAGVGHDEIGKAVRARHLLSIVDCEDPNENTPLSEAASGGNVETIKFLMENNADPNSQGAFLRTPLYRAAFAGHLEAVEVLLSHGADPRIYANDGQTPEHVSCTDAVREVLVTWDMTHTERMLEKLQLDREARRDAERRHRQTHKDKLEGQIDDVQKEHNHWQRSVQKCTEELNKRIYEHETAAAQGFNRPEITLQAVKDAEHKLVMAQLQLDKVREKLQKARLQLREQIAESAKSGVGDDLPGLKVRVRELDDVLFRDVGNKIQDSGKWPLVIDPSEQAATFLRYRDTNYINCLSPRQVEPDRIRMALLGALRFGKPFVIDMMEVDMFDTVSERFSEIKLGLMDDILDKTILQEEKFSLLLKSSDGVEYDKTRFSDFFTRNFKFIILTKNPFPSESLLDRTYPIRVHIPT